MLGADVIFCFGVRVDRLRTDAQQSFVHTLPIADFAGNPGLTFDMASAGALLDHSRCN